MQISIIVAAYNAERYLAETLESVQAQTHQDWELVIIDDGSRDATAAIAQKYAARDGRIRVISQANGGVSSARNQGLAELGPASEAISFLDSDDLWEPNTLETLAHALEASPHAPAAHGVARIVNEQGLPCRNGEPETWGRDRKGIQNKKLIDWPGEAPTTFAVLAYYDCMPVGAIIVRRSALASAGCFDVSLSHGEDWDLWLRLSRLGDIAFVDQVVLLYRRHTDNATAQKRLFRQGELLVARKTIQAPDNTPEQKKIVWWSYRYRERYHANIRLGWARSCWSSRRYVEGLKQLRHAADGYWRFATGALPR